MHVIAGVLVVAALLGFGIYKAFIDPTYVVNVGESIDWTEACVDGHAGLEVNDALTDQVNDQVDVPSLVVQASAEEAVVVSFLSSETEATAAREDLAASVGPEIRADVTRRGSLVLTHPGIGLEDVASTYGSCLVEVSDNKWGAWTGFETQTIGRPFANE